MIYTQIVVYLMYLMYLIYLIHLSDVCTTWNYRRVAFAVATLWGLD